MEPERLIGEIWAIATRAGEAILAARRAGIAARAKADGSPVTEADHAADAVIDAALRALQGDVPIVSEESIAERGAPDVSGGRPFWLVDPLDGTRGFVAGSDEFTVNIALIHERSPVVAVVHAPALRETYAAARGSGAICARDGGPPRPIAVRRAPADGLVALVSRSHDAPAALDRALAPYPVRERRAMNSSIKFCRLAAGEADLYMRLGPTGEWDTAAGHLIVELAGGSVRAADGGPLLYGKPGFKNAEGFAAFGRG